MSGLTQVARRTALSLLSGAAFMFSRAGKGEAAFGDAARVFGSKPTNTTGEFRAAVPLTLTACFTLLVALTLPFSHFLYLVAYGFYVDCISCTAQDLDPPLAWHTSTLLAFSDTLAGTTFGGVVNNVLCCTGFYGYGGEGFSLLLPSQWNPSKEREEPGVVLRYEDNGDSVNNVVVVARKSDKNSIEGYGSPDEFLNKISPLLGDQVFTGGLHQTAPALIPGLVLCYTSHRRAGGKTCLICPHLSQSVASFVLRWP